MEGSESKARLAGHEATDTGFIPVLGESLPLRSFSTLVCEMGLPGAQYPHHTTCPEPQPGLPTPGSHRLSPVTLTLFQARCPEHPPQASSRTLLRLFPTEVDGTPSREPSRLSQAALDAPSLSSPHTHFALPSQPGPHRMASLSPRKSLWEDPGPMAVCPAPHPGTESPGGA